MSGDIFQLYVVDTLGYSSLLVSAVALCMMLSVPLQLLAPRLVDRFGHRWVMVLGSALLLPALLTVFASGFIVSHSRLAAAICLIVGATMAEIGISISFGTAWCAWYAEFTDASQRPLFLSMLSFASQGTVIAAFVIQTVGFNGEVTETFYRGVLAYCLAYIVGSIIIYSQLPDSQQDVCQAIPDKTRWRQLMRVQDYRIILIASTAEFLIGVPLLAVYALTILKVPAAAVGLILIVRSTASLICAPVAGWLIGRVGTLVALRTFGIALFLQMLAWTLLPQVGDTAWAVTMFAMFVAVFQISKATFSLALSTVEFEVVRPEHRVRMFTLVDVVSSTAMQLNLALGSVLVAASATGVFVNTSLIRLDVVKILTGLGAGVALFLMLQYSRMERQRSTIIVTQIPADSPSLDGVRHG